jgi:hypothetical protein
MTADDLRKRLMGISRDVKDTKALRADMLEHWAESKPVGNILLNPTELWMISTLDNRVVGLMQDASAVATALSDAMRG